MNATTFKPGECEIVVAAHELPIKLVTPRDGARMIGRSLTTLKRLVKRGDLHWVRVLGTPMVEVAEIDKFIERHREEGAP